MKELQITGEIPIRLLKESFVPLPEAIHIHLNNMKAKISEEIGKEKELLEGEHVYLRLSIIGGKPDQKAEHELVEVGAHLRALHRILPQDDDTSDGEILDHIDKAMAELAALRAKWRPESVYAQVELQSALEGLLESVAGVPLTPEIEAAGVKAQELLSRIAQELPLHEGEPVETLVAESSGDTISRLTKAYAAWATQRPHWVDPCYEAYCAGVLDGKPVDPTHTLRKEIDGLGKWIKRLNESSCKEESADIAESLFNDAYRLQRQLKPLSEEARVLLHQLTDFIDEEFIDGAKAADVEIDVCYQTITLTHNPHRDVGFNIFDSLVLYPVEGL